MAIRDDLETLMLIPGLSGHEERVAAAIRARLDRIGLTHRTDRLGNVIATVDGDPRAPSVMLFTHMDQLGFIARKVTHDGYVKVERMGGVPERALAGQAVLICVGEGRDVPAIITNKAHHATTPEEKYQVVRAPDLVIDAGFASRTEAEAAGVTIGVPIVYQPRVMALGEHRIAGTSVDDRAGCAVQLAVAEALAGRTNGPTIHLVFSVQEEFNLRGAVVAAQSLRPDIAIQIDLMLASDTPDMAERGEMHLGGGPGISLYSFHGRGTLNGVIPHPALVALMEQSAEALSMPLQRSAQVGVLTDLSYVQLVGEGVASVDVGFPMRYSHSALECADMRDLEALAELLTEALGRIGPDFALSRERRA
ncbi:MAG: M20/M25/M40 family metallo-hydrolase [Roseitalea sp.]|jgi:putative aminopeptidase FrvX|nr:M20/M25/M40 family metallo-hydrolase [Roseitalea sp.]MBO6721497.1 M20/M25/M40 family metallo-hydrolase [Roseitalea sp.]MBO6742054.1 M20/M25/M40 family metallo-hydrolase [Roseitalea sp.]